jgi:hypothetical protein|nr:MAG TPA: Major head protein [Caudoviricetes sp.]
MEDIKNNTATETTAEGTNQATQVEVPGGENTNTNPAEETVTMSKAEYNKAIQAAEDRVRTKYSKDIKALEAKVAELTPVEKTEAERNFEKRLAELERKEKENEAQSKLLSLKASLQSHSIDAGIADYLKSDIDADSFSAEIEKLVSARLAADGYKPSGHQSNQPISKADYDRMSYDEKAELFRRDPDARKRFKN